MGVGPPEPPDAGLAVGGGAEPPGAGVAAGGLVGGTAVGGTAVGGAVIPPEEGVRVQLAATCAGEPIITGNCAAAYPGSLLAIDVVFPALSDTTRFCTV
jgi:hypothetical protein